MCEYVHSHTHTHMYMYTYTDKKICICMVGLANHMTESVRVAKILLKTQEVVEKQVPSEATVRIVGE